MSDSNQQLGDTQETKIAFTVTNSRAETLTFVLEPWGEEYPFAPGDKLLVIFSAANAGEPEIDYGANTVTVYGWIGSRARLFRNDRESPKPGVERDAVGGFPASANVRDLINFRFHP